MCKQTVNVVHSISVRWAKSNLANIFKIPCFGKHNVYFLNSTDIDQRTPFEPSDLGLSF